MADPEKSDWNEFGIFLGIIAAIVTILVGLRALTGVNILKDIFSNSSSTSSASFITTSSNWSGQCNNSCSMHAVFKNIGSDGSETATFHVTSSSDGTDLADCSILLSETPKDGETSGGCTASSSQLDQYWNSNPSGKVNFNITFSP